MPFIPVRSDAFPNLYEAASNQKINWNSGFMYSVQISSSIVKINKDRIQWYEYGTFNPSSLWRKMECEPTHNAFCRIVQDSPPSSVLVFPSGVVDVPVDLHQLRLPDEFSEFMRSGGGLHCDAPTSNRMLSFTDNSYDISMCDLVDGNLELVLEPDANLLYIRQRGASLWLTVVLSFLSLYLFVKTCEHFIKLVHGHRPCFAHGSITLPFLVAVASLVKLVVTDSVLILQEEITLQIIICVYTVIHTGVHIRQHLTTMMTTDARTATATAAEKAPCAHGACKDPASESGAAADEDTHSDFFSEKGAAAVGPLVATQTLLSIELNQTIDTPFLSIYVILFGLRNFLKFLNLINLHCRRDALSSSAKLRKTAETIADTFVFTCLVGIGMQVAAESREQYASNVWVLYVISILTGTLMHRITLLYVPGHES